MDSESIDTLVADALEGTTADPGVGAKALTNPHGLSDYDEGYIEGVRVTHATVLRLLETGALQGRDRHTKEDTLRLINDWLGWSVRRIFSGHGKNVFGRVHTSVENLFPHGHAPGLSKDLRD